MTKPQWRTLSIKVATRKSVAIQAKFPLTPTEWDQLMDNLRKMQPELVAGGDDGG